MTHQIADIVNILLCQKESATNLLLTANATMQLYCIHNYTSFKLGECMTLWGEPSVIINVCTYVVNVKIYR